MATFILDTDDHGVWLAPGKDRLTPICMSDGEIDYEIGRLRKDLDATARRMKAMLAKNRAAIGGLTDSTLTSDLKGNA